VLGLTSKRCAASCRVAPLQRLRSLARASRHPSPPETRINEARFAHLRTVWESRFDQDGICYSGVDTPIELHIVAAVYGSFSSVVGDGSGRPDFCSAANCRRWQNLKLRTPANGWDNGLVSNGNSLPGPRRASFLRIEPIGCIPKLRQVTALTMAIGTTGATFKATHKSATVQASSGLIGFPLRAWTSTTGKILMPVLLDRGPLGYRSFSAAEGLRGRPQPEFREGDANCIDLGLINNMPDSALEQTERQVLKLLDSAAGDIIVRLRLFSLSEVPRSALGQQHLKRLSYASAFDLWSSSLDGLIVTGAEPKAADLRQEPYWSELADVFDWADGNTISTVCSCLAVHAAVLHIDGIGRRALGEKCFGVFEFPKLSSHPIMTGTPSRLRIPHSRWNEVSGDALSSCGYTILDSSPHAGVDMFLKKRRRSLFVFFQGHPEYEAWTLVGEYRRDIERFRRRERDTYPTMPQGYLDEGTVKIFNEFREQALSDRRQEVLEEFPTALVAGKLTDPWRATASQVYRNWLLHMSAVKAERL
jgi:homoserine O-succinyltransferase/O-acetyltransferase